MAAYMCRSCARLSRILPVFNQQFGLQIQLLAQSTPFKISSAKYAKKSGKGGKGGVKAERLYDILEVNTDPKYLVENCAGTNYFKEGTDVKLKPDEEYPDWLWSLHTGRARPLQELDPDTPQYWRRLRKMHMNRNNRLSKGKKF